MTLATRPHLFAARAAGIDTAQITRTSKLVAHLTGMAVQANKAVVGANAFAHESGIHQDGMLKNASTYEIMTPASVGLSKTALVLGKHSGRAAYAARLRDLGLSVAGADLSALVDKLKALADEKKIVTDADIEALAYAGLARVAAPTWSLEAAHVFTGSEAKPTATVTLRHVASGDERSAAAIGCGPVDAVYNAIRGIVNRPNDLVDFAIKSATDGTNALGEVTIKVAPAADGSAGKRQVGHLPRVAAAADAEAEAAAKLSRFNDPAENTGKAVYSGTSVDKDIVVAAARAYVAALNRLLAADETRGAVLGAGAIGVGV
jgi:2-isopropylmalate synthase